MHRALTMFTALLSIAAAGSNLAAEMTPLLIQEAVNDVKGIGCHEVGRGIGGTAYGCFTTPYSRVVQAATAARKKYKPFTPADVTPEMVAPELRLFVFPRPMPRGPGIVNVEAVVIIPRGAKDPAAAIHPTATAATAEDFRNLLGATFEGRGLIATFPLTALTESNEFRFVFDGPACAGGFAPKTECAAKISLDKVR